MVESGTGEQVALQPYAVVTGGGLSADGQTLDELGRQTLRRWPARHPATQMVGLGILEGDLVVVKPQKVAESGDVVVAAAPDGEGTVKTLRRKDGRLFLEAANPKYSPIPEPFEVAGKVIAVIRRL